MASSTSHSVDLAQAMVLEPVSAASWLLVVPVVLPLFAGAFLLMLRSKTQWHANFTAMVFSIHFMAASALLAQVVRHGPQTMTMGKWLPPFGISFSADILGALLTVSASLIAILCTVFSGPLINDKMRRNGFYTFMLLMMGGVSGAFITGDIFNLYVWFEVLLIASFGLIIIGGKKLQLDGAVKYTFLNLIATTLFLIATGYLYGAVGTLNMADITMKMESIHTKAPINTIALLYFVAFGMKAAAFPLNFWLPASYHTPKLIVSALFAGLLTKVGVYALLRTMAMLFAVQMQSFSTIVMIAAILTMVFGVLGALAQSDLRRVAGYMVVSGIGSMIAGIALSTEMSLAGSIFYAVHSMLSMTALYLMIIVIGIRAGTYDLRQLGGFYSASPFFSAGFIIVAFALSGLPPFSGFWPKFLLVKASIAASNWWLVAAILLTGFLTSIAMFRVWNFVFWRGGAEGARDGTESWKLEQVNVDIDMNATMTIGILVAFIIYFGFNPDTLISLSMDGGRSLIDPAGYIGSVFGAGG